VTDPNQLSRMISDAAIGSTATLAVVRDGRRTEVRVPIGRVTRQ
jgi:S1-C subfamily serine protease